MAYIGRSFAKRRKLRFQPLLRRTSGGTQHLKSKKERLTAAQNAFELISDDLPMRVLLIDDVLTTGATLRANLNLLQGVGVASLYGAIIARQPKEKES
jgi:predicted amidophosphoribosyltransferase